METFEAHYDTMRQAVLDCLPASYMALVDRAVEYAQNKHKEQKRKDGSPYIIHPLAVAEIVAEMGLDLDAVLAALLHDCIEDTDASFDDIAKRAGAGTLVPITGFANAVVSPAVEFKTEGFVTGTATKLFQVAGPVLVFGISASVIYGLILCLLK